MGVSRKAISALQGLPFDNLIGGPLNACISAQADAAQSTLNFIEQVGLNEDENGNKEAVYVYFSFIQNGRKAVLSVPLLTIVPIPYICINTIDINFKASVSGVESSSFTNSLSEDYSRETKTEKKKGWFRKKTTSINTSFSSKKDSTATKNSSFSIEATIDVAVHASQESMPAGMAKILEMLGGALDVCDPNGELSVSDTMLYINSKSQNESEKAALLVAQYKSPEGLFTTEGLKCLQGSSEIKPLSSGSPSAISATFKLNKPGTYTVKVGEQETQVEVKDLSAAPNA